MSRARGHTRRVLRRETPRTAPRPAAAQRTHQPQPTDRAGRRQPAQPSHHGSSNPYEASKPSPAHEPARTPERAAFAAPSACRRQPRRSPSPHRRSRRGRSAPVAHEKHQIVHEERNPPTAGPPMPQPPKCQRRRARGHNPGRIHPAAPDRHPTAPTCQVRGGAPQRSACPLADGER